MSNNYINCGDCGVPFHPDSIGFECKKCENYFGECCVDDPDDFECPICSLKVISVETLFDFALLKLKKTWKELEEDYRREHKS